MYNNVYNKPLQSQTNQLASYSVLELEVSINRCDIKSHRIIKALVNYWLAILKTQIVWTQYTWRVWRISYKPAVIQGALDIFSWFPVPSKLFPLWFKWMWLTTLVGLKTMVSIITYVNMVTLQIEYSYLTIHCRLFTIPAYVVARILTAFIKIYRLFRSTICTSEYITVFCESSCRNIQQIQL